MMDNASPEDSVIIGDRLAQITAAFEALQRNAAARRRALEHGLAQASEGKKLRSIQNCPRSQATFRFHLGEN